MFKKVLIVIFMICTMFGIYLYRDYPTSVMRIAFAVIRIFDSGPDIDYEDTTDTLAGIDADNNGLRDDVERYIMEQTKNLNKDLQIAMINDAKATYGYFLLKSLSDADVIEQHRLASDTSFCYGFFQQVYIESYYPHFDKLVKNIEKLMLNTEKRRKYLIYDIDHNLYVENRRQSDLLVNLDRVCKVNVKEKNLLIAKLYRSRKLSLKLVISETSSLISKYPAKITKEDQNEIIDYFKSLNK